MGVLGCSALSGEETTTGNDDCCLHDRPGEDDVVCCWCGDLYLRDDDRTDHGEYAPKPAAAAKTKRTPGQPPTKKARKR